MLVRKLADLADSVKSAADSAYSEGSKLAMQAKLNTEIALLRERIAQVKRKVCRGMAFSRKDPVLINGGPCARASHSGVLTLSMR